MSGRRGCGKNGIGGACSEKGHDSPRKDGGGHQRVENTRRPTFMEDLRAVNINWDAAEAEAKLVAML